MKNRTGFVANSSSSSYIIAIDKEHSGQVGVRCPTCNRAEIDFIEIVNKLSNTYFNTGVEEEGFKEINDYYATELAWADKDEKKEIMTILKKVKEAEDNGKNVYRISISINDTFLNDCINNSKYIEILDKEYE